MASDRLTYMQRIGLAVTLCGGGVTCLAQPAMSRGQQHLPINYDECLNRARQALTNVGFTSTGAGNFAQGFKEASGAYITCNDAPGGGMSVNIFVATITNDAGVPGLLRQCLQAQMERPGTRSACSRPGQPAACGAPDFFNTRGFDWIDNGHSLGAVTFFRDGSTKVCCWTNDRHFWSNDSGNGDLMIRAPDPTSTATVIRLHYDQSTCSFKGQRDSTSQRQDGVRTELRPK
jgi:hypothetical protein